MSQVEEPAKKLTIHDRVEDFSQKTFEQAEAKKVLVRNLKGLVHKVVRIRRKNLLKGATYTSSPIGMMQGSVFRRRVGDDEWKFDDSEYNICGYGKDFPQLVGVVVNYEVLEKETGGAVNLIVVAPNDRFEYKFSIRFSEIEVLEGYPPAE
ncbi:MAG: hypothetical protein JWO96_406 [Candidatus Saccharibacteria bacterium]|nr:hypothetical protein [Candidatus Saccharibacteria bacterium]